MKTPRLPASMNLKGKLLLAAPSMEDTFFEKTVIMVIRHSEAKGAKGFVLNKPLGKTFAEEFANDPDFPQELSGISFFNGGPVQKNKLNMFAFSRQEDKLLYKTGISLDETRNILQTPNTLIHCFAGHSSWVSGQLEQELAEGTWIILPALSQLIDMAHDKTLWQQILRQASPMHALLSRAPKHSFFN